MDCVFGFRVRKSSIEGGSLDDPRSSQSSSPARMLERSNSCCPAFFFLEEGGEVLARTASTSMKFTPQPMNEMCCFSPLPDVDDVEEAAGSGMSFWRGLPVSTDMMSMRPSLHAIAIA